jgi:hypothetical protein
MLKFSPANAKIEALNKVAAVADFLGKSRKVYSFDLLSGYTCPFAHDCQSFAVEKADGSRSIEDGENTEFRCFSASQEVLYTNVYKLRKHNRDTLQSTKNQTDLILGSIPKNAGVIRIHVGGDMYNREYFNTWIDVSKRRDDVLFYAYTKSLPYWVTRKSEINDIFNFVLTASYGGRRDNLIQEYNLRYSKVVYSINEAESLGLEIDHDDSHAANPFKKHRNFALLIHGVQPKGSTAGQAVRALKGEGSYRRK